MPMTPSNPYASSDQAALGAGTEVGRKPSRLVLGLIYVPAFLFGCAVGMEAGYNGHNRSVRVSAIESLLWQQPFGILVENVAAWLGASLIVGSVIFRISQPESVPACVLRGLLAGCVFSLPMFGTLWLNMILVQRGLALPEIFFPNSLLLRYVLYAGLAILCDVFLVSFFNAVVRTGRSQ